MHDWLNFNEELRRSIDEEQNFSLLRYMPYTIMAFHQHYASTGPRLSSHSTSYICRRRGLS
jgi:hypothetical protein